MAYAGTFTENHTLLECAKRLNISLVNVCGGSGACGKCIVRILDGSVSPVRDAEKKHIDPEKLEKGYRLACCTVPKGDCRVSIPRDTLSTLSRAQVEGMDIEVDPEPAVQIFRVSMTPPSMEDVTPDLERLQSVLNKNLLRPPATADLEVLKHISSNMRTASWKLQVAMHENEIIGLLPENVHPLGLAVDLGTTKIAAYLADLSTGKVLRSKGILNPQTVFGDDVISRIAVATQSTNDALTLQQLIVKAINSLVHDMCEDIQAEMTSVTDIIIGANTAMHHLLLGLPVRQLSRAPYVPVTRSAVEVKARSIGIEIAPGAYLRMLPNIAGYIGSDHVAMILAAGIHKRSDTVLALDIGTNTEICLATKNRITCLSCASGPAFEGAHIKCGMRVTDGAIEHVGFSEKKITFQTIGDFPAAGICGSGIIDATAALLCTGIVDTSGRMAEGPGVRENQGQLEFVIASNEKSHRDVTFTQKDIREVQLAKGAISAGIQVLLHSSGIDMADINAVIIAGAFGTYIDIQSAVEIGMLPDLPLERFQQVGNAAGMGAKMALLSRQKWEEAKAIAERVTYIELASYPGFNKIFARAMGLEKQTQK